MLTLLAVTLIGRVAGGHMWIGALVTGIVEAVVGVLLLKKGMSEFTEPSYSLEQTRESLAGRMRSAPDDLALAHDRSAAHGGRPATTDRQRTSERASALHRDRRAIGRGQANQARRSARPLADTRRTR